MLATFPLAALVLASCENSSVISPIGANQAQFTQNITLPGLDSTVVSGTARVVIRLARNDSLTARRILVKLHEDLNRPEEIEGRVTAVASGGAADTLTFGDLGGLKVVINDSTRFRGDLDDADTAGHDGDHLVGASLDDGPGGMDEDRGRAVFTRSAFSTRLAALIAAGRRPNVDVRRPAPAKPQAPGDGSFVAATVRLDEGDEAAEIEMNVDSANFSLNTTPPPLGFVTVLGLKIAITSATRITADMPDAEGEGRFAGIVKSVDTTAHTVTLQDSTVLRIVAGTEIEDGENGMGLKTLADVQAALAAGKTVNAHGRGVLETAGPPRTIVVIEVRFFAGTTMGM